MFQLNIALPAKAQGTLLFLVLSVLSLAVQAITIHFPGGGTYTFLPLKSTSDESTFDKSTFDKSTCNHTVESVSYMTLPTGGISQLSPNCSSGSSGFQQLKAGALSRDDRGDLAVAVVVTADTQEPLELGVQYLQGGDTTAQTGRVSVNGMSSALENGWAAASVRRAEEPQNQPSPNADQSIINVPGRHLLWLNVPNVLLRDIPVSAARIKIGGRGYELSGASSKQPDLPVSVLLHFRSSRGAELLTVHYSSGDPLLKGGGNRARTMGFGIGLPSAIGGLGGLIVCEDLGESQASEPGNSVEGEAATAQQPLSQKADVGVALDDKNLQKEMRVIGKYLNPYLEKLMVQMGFAELDIDAVKGREQAGYEFLYLAGKRGLLSRLYPASQSPKTGLFSLARQIERGPFPLLRTVIQEAIGDQGEGMSPIDQEGDQTMTLDAFKLIPVGEADWQGIEPIVSTRFRFLPFPRLVDMMALAGLSRQEMTDMQQRWQWQQQLGIACPIVDFINCALLFAAPQGALPRDGGHGRVTYKDWVEYLDSTDDLKMNSLAYYTVDCLKAKRVKPFGSGDLLEFAEIIHNEGNTDLALRVVAGRPSDNHYASLCKEFAHGQMKDGDYGLGIQCEDGRCEQLSPITRQPGAKKPCAGLPTLAEAMKRRALTPYVQYLPPPKVAAAVTSPPDREK